MRPDHQGRADKVRRMALGVRRESPLVSQDARPHDVPADLALATRVAAETGPPTFGPLFSREFHAAARRHDL